MPVVNLHCISMELESGDCVQTCEVVFYLNGRSLEANAIQFCMSMSNEIYSRYICNLRSAHTDFAFAVI